MHFDSLTFSLSEGMKQVPEMFCDETLAQASKVKREAGCKSRAVPPL
jgi:hypothetical protein